jgi:hypothetical protein
MSDKPPRAPRKEAHQPTTIHYGDSSFDAELRDISDTGAAIEFDFSSSTQPNFNIGHPVELDMADNERKTGRVVRHYAGGFAMAFDDKKS